MFCEKSAGHESVRRYKLAECPEGLKKKVATVKYFRDNLCAEGDVGTETALAYTPNYIQSQMVYVKKWMKLQNATMFRLSNKLVQIIFDDRTAILFDIERKQMTYTGYSGEKSVYALSAVLESGNADMIKRFKCAKDVLAQLLSSGTKSRRGIVLSEEVARLMYSKTVGPGEEVQKYGLVQQGCFKGAY